ncbi:pilus assembly protein TadG [Bradyrhizobium manausense]|uniref:pilus assembly protein TadG-related protein n=1 Tax=Bradyrhizobium manausense TaxID=989370 RepID=UPI001BAAD826|nr:pilus assembly protein TadG-related protein [Bradyrhizobium manausense]MBR0832241.1 pilus assembly protein TadG [Bradyrhizobium manausense]
MRDLLRSRRGSVAFATVVALVPLIGAVALGAEAGSWYVIRQHAQNAADAAAYSGGLTVACTLSASASCDSSQSYIYRGKQAASQNSFCNTGDNAYSGSTCSGSLPAGTSQNVTIASLASWNGVSGNYVQATVTQQQNTSLAVLLGLSTVTVGATAVASVATLAKPPCVLALKDPITFQGSPTLSSADCGISSNSRAANSIGFVGNNGLNINAPSYAVGGCSQTGGSQCTNVQTYQQPIPDPLSSVNTAIAALKTSDFPKPCSGLQPYESGACYNAGNQTINSTTLGGTYYFNGDIKISGASTTIKGTATLILFGNATLTINGGPTIQLTAMASPAGPFSSSVLKLMAGLLLYDGETTTKSKSVTVGGSATSYFDGTVYVPNSPLNYGGNSSSSAPNPGCYQVIAYSVNFSGNTSLDNSGCKSFGGGAPGPNVQTVRLVQ